MTEFWNITPNWAGGLTADYEFLTEIETSRSGKESRRALRSTPRRSLSFSALAEGARLRALGRLMVRAQNGELKLPDFARRTYTATALPTSGNSVTAEEVPDWIAAGKEIALVDGRRSELRTVTAVNGNTVTFAEAATAPWPSGTSLSPILQGRVNPAFETRRETDSVATMTVDFTVTPTSEDLDDGEIDSDAIFGQREVWFHRPNWREPPQVAHLHPVETVDFERGPVAHFSPIEFASRTLAATYSNRSAAETQSMIDFFTRRKGRRGEFYMPTFESDLVPIEGASEDATTLLVADSEVHETFAGDTVFRNIAVITYSGFVFFRRIAATAAEGSNTRITLTSPWPADIPLHDIEMISWLTVMRFSTDTLRVKWITDQVAEMRISFTAIEDLEPEGMDGILDGAALYMISTYGWSFTCLDLADPLQYAVNVQYPQSGGA